MRAGKLDRQITIQQAGSTLDAYGQPTQTWSTFAIRHAQKRDIRPSERFAAGQRLAEETAVFRIRHLDGVTPQMRIQLEGKTYDIHGITELGRRVGLDLLAVAEANNGSS